MAKKKWLLWICWSQNWRKTKPFLKGRSTACQHVLTSVLDSHKRKLSKLTGVHHLVWICEMGGFSMCCIPTMVPTDEPWLKQVMRLTATPPGWVFLLPSHVQQLPSLQQFCVIDHLIYQPRARLKSNFEPRGIQEEIGTVHFVSFMDWQQSRAALLG